MLLLLLELLAKFLQLLLRLLIFLALLLLLLPLVRLPVLLVDGPGEVLQIELLLVILPPRALLGRQRLRGQLLLLLLALVAVALAKKASVSSTPSFCHGLDCPAYTTVSSNATANVEIRDYSNATGTWASVNVSSMDYTSAVSAGFMKLFKYIQGANVGNHTVEMAAPVLVEVIPGAGPTCNSTFIVSFFTPFADQANPPVPNANGVFITRDRYTGLFAVTEFSGFANSYQTDIAPHAAAVYSYLQAQKLKFDPTVIFAGYDSPFRVIDRHNEVWIRLI